MLSKSLKTIINCAFPGGEKAKLNILIFHQIHKTKRKMFINSDIDEKDFLWQMKLLKTYFNILDFNDAILKLKAGKLPSRSVVITFDDGYHDNFDVAFPILSSLDIPATFFIATGFLNGGIMWNDKIIFSIDKTTKTYLDLSDYDLDKYNIDSDINKSKTIVSLVSKIKYKSPDFRDYISNRVLDILNITPPTNRMMTDNQIVELANNGMTIGAHTVTHPILSSLDNETAYNDIKDSKHYLENLINKPIKYFAYPNGRPGIDYKYQHVEMVRNIGFDASVSTSYGTSNKYTDIYQLPRFTPWDQGFIKYLTRLYINTKTIPIFS